ncbi:MAG: hypothetical protein E7184_02185 [Erysipelotrichaceae bacterium]|nr:hypothetical protein [Erysipelotrichaceae bacterium]
MIYEFLKANYSESEPIFLYEIKGYSKNYIRQEMKKLADEGKIERFYNGVYYLPYTTILGTKGKISITKFIEKKYLYFNEKISGFYTGLYLSNLLGLTSQNPSCYEICSNFATTKQRKQPIEDINIVIYKPVAEVTKKNYKELQFLDLMLNIDKYSELSKEETTRKIKKYIKQSQIDFKIVKQYLPLYPDKIYRNIYEGGIMDELV